MFITGPTKWTSSSGQYAPNDDQYQIKPRSLSSPLFCCSKIKLHASKHPTTGKGDCFDFRFPELLTAFKNNKFRKGAAHLNPSLERFVKAVEYCISVWTPAHAPNFMYESVIIPTDGMEDCFTELSTEEWETHRRLFREGIERFGQLRCVEHRRSWTLLLHLKKNNTAADNWLQSEEEMKKRRNRTVGQFRLWDFKDEDF